jgi:DNA-binding NarL/FixJ family response regulator
VSDHRKPRILLADDQQIVVEGLRRLLESDFEICGIAVNGIELAEMARDRRPDLIVPDISMPLLNGINSIRRLRDQGFDSKVIFLTMHPDATYVTRAIEAGASGYVLRHTASEDLTAAIAAALRGGTFISAQLRGPGVQSLLHPTRRHLRQSIELTPRQREVLQLLAVCWFSVKWREGALR